MCKANVTTSPNPSFRSIRHELPRRWWREGGTGDTKETAPLAETKSSARSQARSVVSAPARPSATCWMLNAAARCRLGSGDGWPFLHKVKCRCEIGKSHVGPGELTLCNLWVVGAWGEGGYNWCFGWNGRRDRYYPGLYMVAESVKSMSSDPQDTDRMPSIK